MTFLFIILCFILQVMNHSSSAFNVEGRIVGGANVDIATVPYQAGLQYDGSLSCGGENFKVLEVLNTKFED